MDSDHTVTATCTPLYALTVTSNGCSPILVSNLPQDNQTVPAGGNSTFSGIPQDTDVTLTAQLGDSCQFGNWTVDGQTNTNQTIEVTMDTDHTATLECSDPPVEQTYTAVDDFSTENGNQNGVWSYAWMPTDFSSFNLYTNHSSFQWYGWGNDYTPGIWLNTISDPYYGVPLGWLSLHPGNGYQPSVLRWTAPAAGDVRVTGQFLPGDSGYMTVAVRLDNQPWWSAGDSGAFDLTTSVVYGTTIDFAVYGGYGFGNTPISATISYQN